jgi:acyl carrier protein
MVKLFTEVSDSTFASITGLGAMFSAVKKGATRVSISWLSVVFASVAATTEMASAGGYVQRRNVLQNKEYIIREELLKLLRDDIEMDIDNTPIAELGIDSLDFFEMLLQIEEDHGIEIEIDKLDEKITLQTLVALV